MWLLVAAPRELIYFYYHTLEAAFAAHGITLTPPCVTQRRADGSPALYRLSVRGTFLCTLLCNL